MLVAYATTYTGTVYSAKMQHFFIIYTITKRGVAQALNPRRVYGERLLDYTRMCRVIYVHMRVVAQCVAAGVLCKAKQALGIDLVLYLYCVRHV